MKFATSLITALSLGAVVHGQEVYGDYQSAKARADATGKPMVLFRGSPARSVPGAVSCRVELDFAQPSGSVLLLTGADDASIRAALSGGKVGPLATAFAGKPTGRDDSFDGRGPWPEKIDFPARMIRFRRARMTQYVDENSYNGGPFVHRIIPTPREQSEPKYRVSGGMVGLSGWRSDVYRNDAKPTSYRGWVEVFNGANNQSAQARVRWYPDGARFLDVLSTERGVFAVRQREKVRGVWDYRVLHEDLANAPAGYRPVPLKECQSCHREAGSGNYAAALVPGGDETFSDPMEGLE